jgi:ubiquinol-cytochrome c reductase cytochrome c subunit
MPHAISSSLFLGALLLTVSTAALADGDAQRGKTAFMTNGCYECHGTVGQGGASGPSLAPRSPAATAIAHYIRDPKGAMPPYVQKVLSDADIADIAAYLKSLPAPKSPDQIPELSGH